MVASATIPASSPSGSSTRRTRFRPRKVSPRIRSRLDLPAPGGASTARRFQRVSTPARFGRGTSLRALRSQGGLPLCFGLLETCRRVAAIRREGRQDAAAAVDGASGGGRRDRCPRNGCGVRVGGGWKGRGRRRRRRAGGGAAISGERAGSGRTGDADGAAGGVHRRGAGGGVGGVRGARGARGAGERGGAVGGEPGAAVRDGVHRRRGAGEAGGGVGGGVGGGKGWLESGHGAGGLWVRRGAARGGGGGGAGGGWESSGVPARGGRGGDVRCVVCEWAPGAGAGVFASGGAAVRGDRGRGGGRRGGGERWRGGAGAGDRWGAGADAGGGRRGDCVAR